MNDTKHESKKNASHTPGPWEIDATVPNSYLRIVGNIDGDAYDDGSTRYIYTHVCDVLDNEEEEANAHLIAAAPTMEAACEAAEQCIADFIELYKRGCSMLILDEAVKSLRDDALAKVRVALAEAKGLAV